MSEIFSCEGIFILLVNSGMLSSLISINRIRNPNFSLKKFGSEYIEYEHMTEFSDVSPPRGVYPLFRRWSYLRSFPHHIELGRFGLHTRHIPYINLSQSGASTECRLASLCRRSSHRLRTLSLGIFTERCASIFVSYLFSDKSHLSMEFWDQNHGRPATTYSVKIYLSTTIICGFLQRLNKGLQYLCGMNPILEYVCKQKKSTTNSWGALFTLNARLSTPLHHGLSLVCAALFMKNIWV